MDKQVGGRHYLGYEISPIEWSLDNHINAAEFSILRYVLRYCDKNGLEDLDKAIHYTYILMDRPHAPKNMDAISNINNFCITNALISHQHNTLVALFNQDYNEVLRGINSMSMCWRVERG